MIVKEIVLFNSKKTEYSQSYTPLEYISLQKSEIYSKTEA